MADNVVKVNIVADATQLEKTVGGLKKKLAEALDVNGFSLAEINPWKLAADGIRKSIEWVAGEIRNFGANMVKSAEETASAGKKINATAFEYARLSEAAASAGVSAQAFAEAVERIKSGEASLDDIASAWERIAESSGVSASNINAVAQLRAYMEKHDTGELNAAQYLWANLTGDYQAGQSLSKLMAQVNNGRRTLFSPDEVMDEVWGKGQRSKGWGQASAERVFGVLGVLNSEIVARIKRDIEERKAEEAKRKAEEAESAKRKAEVDRIIEADRKAEAARKAREQAEIASENAQAKRDEEALADRVAKAYTGLLDVVGGEAGRLVQEAFGLDSATMGRLLDLGLRRAATPEAEIQEMMARERAEQDARKREQAEAEAERTRLTEREADLQKRIRETEGELSASWMTSAGGSLIGGGSFALAMAERMRAIDREEKQREMVEELRGVREELRKIVRNTNE